MKFSMVAVMSVALLVASAFADEKGTPGAADPALKEVRQKASYGLGVSIGKSLMTQAADIDPELFSQGLKDALAGKPSRMTDQQIQEALMAYQQELVTKKTKEGETFLAENKKKE